MFCLVVFSGCMLLSVGSGVVVVGGCLFGWGSWCLVFVVWC